MNKKHLVTIIIIAIAIIAISGIVVFNNSSVSKTTASATAKVTSVETKADKLKKAEKIWTRQTRNLLLQNPIMTIYLPRVPGLKSRMQLPIFRKLMTI